MWSVGRLDNALRMGGSSIPLDAIDHLTLDYSYGHRVSELLFWQLIGIFVGQALRAQRSFQFAVPHPPPKFLQLEGVGCVFFKVEHPLGEYIISVEGNEFSLCEKQSCTKVTIETTKAGNFHNFALTLEHRLSEQICIAFNNGTLNRQHFQMLPLLLGEKANMRFSDQLNRCLNSLEECRIDGLSGVLELCKSVIGLVSLSKTIGSASREEALGLVFLPAGTDDTNLAECFVHEALHQFLFRIEQSAEIFTQECSTVDHFYSPWRADGRPLRMILHGAFVFSGIASIHLHWIRQQGSILNGNLETAFQRVEESALAIGIVKRYGLLSATGEKIVAAVDAEIKHARNLIGDTDYPWIRDAIQKRRNEFPDFIS
jgi:HEXXH motif-containing protein